jgi:16S rRNA (adenine1518-N6/adenine1519-N6)-dimethyltransferase
MTTPSPASARQTVSYLRNLFEERGLHPKSKLGQNFLIDLNLIEVLLRAADLSPDDLVLEVGSGTGSLTVRLVDLAGAVVSVEVDPAFAEMTDEAVTKRRDRVALLHADVLKNKNELNPALLHAIEDLRARLRTITVKLVANLPYAVATPVITNLLLSELSIERMVVTVQWEIAERLMASPGTKDYGALAVLVQSVADVTLVRKLPPTVFWPRPQVESAIVKVMPNVAKRAEVGDVMRFRRFLRDLYAHRRKNLRGGLVSMAGRGLIKQDVDAKLTELGFDGKVRAEALDLKSHLTLCAAFG